MKYCKHDGCGKQASYGVAGGKTEYCVEHAPIGHVDVKHKRCQDPKCGKQPSYGPPGTKRGIFCLEHSSPDHVNVTSNRCRHLNCEKQPSYGPPDTKGGIFCSEHSPLGHINVINTKCAHPKCEKIPNYGPFGTKRGVFCSEHSLPEHVDVTHKKCSYLNCKKRPTYGPPGTKRGVFCSEHSLPEYVNVVSKRCSYPKCETRPYYGVPSYPAEYCAKHKLLTHIPHPMKVKSEDFKTCEFCEHRIHYKQSYCESCKTYLSLGKTVKRHEKELAVKALLERNHITFTHDSRISEGCSKYRPDFVISHPSGASVILEVDEHQHNRKNYSCECELTRMRQIYFDIGGAQVMFIRYNPDSYKVARGLQEDSRTERETFLSKYLSRVLSTELGSPLSVVYLYYDHFDKSNPETEVIEPY